MRIVVVMFVFLIGVSYVNAQCRGFRVINQPYIAPVVHQEVVKEVLVPVAVPVLIPAFQYQYAPPPPCAVMPPPAVPVQNPGFMPGFGAQPGFGTNPGSAPPPANGFNSRDKIKELAKALLEEMSKQSEAGQEDDGPPAVFDPSAPPKSNSPPRSAPGGVPPGGVPPGGAPPGLPGGQTGQTREQAAPLALAALSRNCAQCHTGSGSKGDMVMFTQPGVISNEAPWDLIADDIRKGRMPPKNSQFRLTKEEKSSLLIWLGSSQAG